MVEEAWEESVIEKLQSLSSSSSSDSDNENPFSGSAKAKIYRLFGREKPVHMVLGGGKTADVFLWRNRKLSGGLLGFATAIWVLFEYLEYHLLTLVCHCLIVSLVVLFLWSNGSKYIKRCSPHIREVYIPEEPVLQVALAIRIETNNALVVLHHTASGKDLKKFLSAITGLWVLSVLGSCCNILTLLYMAFVLLHTLPVLYEKYEDEVDSFAEKALAGLKKQCSVIESKFSIIMSKGLKDKKLA